MISTQQTYGVALSCYRRASGATRLTSVALDRVEADSPQEAVYGVMQRHGHPFVDHVEVTLPDGATWQRDHVLSKNTYDVALYRRDRPTELPIIAELQQADSPLLAALSLMQQNTLTYVSRVAVRCPDGSIWRKEHLKREPVEQEEGELL